MQMSASEREAYVRRRLYAYREMCERKLAYSDKVFGHSGGDESGVRGTDISDPTARMAMAIADPPRRLKLEWMWIKVIDDALMEMMTYEGDRLPYIADNVFCMHLPRKKTENRKAMDILCDELSISRRTLYRRIDTIVRIVAYHATRARVL